MNYENLDSISEALEQLAALLTEARRGAPGSAKARFQSAFRKQRASGSLHPGAMLGKAAQRAGLRRSGRTGLSGTGHKGVARAKVLARKRQAVTGQVPVGSRRRTGVTPSRRG